MDADLSGVMPSISQEAVVNITVNGTATSLWRPKGGAGAGMQIVTSATTGAHDTVAQIFTNSSQIFEWKTSANTLAITTIASYTDNLLREGQ